MRRMLGTMVVAALVAVGSAPAGNADAHSCGDPFIQIVQPDDGQLVVNGGVVPLPIGQSLTISTTGEIDVVMEFGCADFWDLEVTKTAPGNPTVIHQSHLDPESCDGTVSETVTIGLDGGEYSFAVNGDSCLGRKLRGDGHGGTVVDPPLPL